MRVTYHRAGYADLSADSGAATVAKGEFTAATPAISGAVKVGEQLSVVAGAWSPTPASIDYEWQLDGKAIGGATDAMHTVVASELGHDLSVVVHVHAAGYDDASATSAAAEGRGRHAAGRDRPDHARHVPGRGDDRGD